MFGLKQQVKLASVNARAEIHGDERKSAFDLKFDASVPSADLIEFHPSLRAFLYKEATSPDLASQGGDDKETELRFPLLGDLKWDWEGTGYHLEVEYGTGGKSNIKLGDVKIDKFKISPQNGGTVLIEFRAIVHPESKDVGKLCEMIQTDIGIHLISPEEADSKVKRLHG